MFHPVLEDVYKLFHEGHGYVTKNHVYKYKDFSECIFETQIDSKKWLSETIGSVVHENELEVKEIDIVASWYGIVIVPFIRHALGDHIKFNLYDVDWYTTEISKYMFRNDDKVTVNTNDIVFDEIDFPGDTFINCSCEHMFDMKDIYEQNKGKLFVFQSNNNRNVKWMHINCVDDAEELIQQTGLQKVMFSGSKHILRSKRIMVMGK